MPVVAAGLLLAAGIVAAGGYALWRQRQPSTTPPSASLTAADEPPSASAPATAEIVQSRLAQAQAAVAAGNFRAAQAYAAAVLASEPNNREALTIREQSTAALERFEKALALTRQRLAANDVQAAARALADAREIDPTSPAVTELAATLALRVQQPGFGNQTQGRRGSGVDAAPLPPPSRAESGTPGPAHSVESAAAPSTAPAPPPASSQPPAPEASAPSPAAPTSANSNSGTPPERTNVERPAPAAPPVVTSPPDRVAPPAPGRPSPTEEEAAVRRVVASYARAIESKDVSLFRSVKPNLSREEERRLQEGFRAVVSQQVQITPLSIDINQQDATVTAQRRDVIDAGGRRQTVESRQTFRLSRTGAGWVITDIR
jgi:hypothetical protein